MQVEALKAAAKGGQDPALQKQVQRVMAQADHFSHQLAHLHGERDRALVEMTRLEEVAPLARNENGVNKRIVSAVHNAHVPLMVHLVARMTAKSGSASGGY